MSQQEAHPTQQSQFGQPKIQETDMPSRPQEQSTHYRGSGKLQGKVALITGADSGIGHAAAVAFAKEGADVAIVYHDAHEDARRAQQEIEQQGRKAIIVAGDVGDETFCQQAIEQTIQQLGKLDILVNNAAEQHPQQSIEEISAEQLERTFRTNIFSMFFMTRAALKHLPSGGTIINTTSVTAYKGAPQLLDYSATKGAIVAFTRSLSQSLVQKGIRVNAIAPGPIWTPLIVQTMPKEQVEQFGKQVPMQRAGQPDELAAAYVFLASDDSSYMAGQTLHLNGGEVVNG